MRLLPLLSVLPTVTSLNVLIYLTLVGKSHVQFVSTLVDKLVERGHSVDVISAQLNSLVKGGVSKKARTVVEVGFDGESPWNAGTTHLLNAFEDLQTWRSLLNSPFPHFASSTAQLCDLVLASNDVDELLSTREYDVALISCYDLCPFALMHHHNIKRVATFTATPAMRPQLEFAGIPSLPLYENNILDSRVNSDHSSLWYRVTDHFRLIFDMWTSRDNNPHMTEKFRARFGPDFPTGEELFAKTASLDFANSHPLLDDPTPTAHKLKLVGGVGLPSPKPVDEKFEKILSRSRRGAVLFSFGTQVAYFPPAVIEVFVESFKHFPDYTFIWKLNATERLNASNIVTVDWLPQTSLLYDDRVVSFISHMGLNSFTEVSFAGKSVLAVPLFADQFHNARCARRLGTGVIVEKTALTVSAVVAALHDVLSPKYVNRAREVARMLSAYPDSSTRTFIEGVEFVAKFDNLQGHLNLAGAKHNFFVRNGWDVALILTLTALLSTLTFAALAIVVTSKLLRLVRISVIKAKSD